MQIFRITARWILAVGIIAHISGCTRPTESRTANVAVFAETVSTQLDAVEKQLAVSARETGIPADRRAAMAETGASYQLGEGSCSPFGAFEAEETDEQLRIAQRCELIPYLGGQKFEEGDFAQRERDLRHSRTLAKALDNYATGLKEIATAETTKEVGDSFGKAFAAVQGAANAAVKLDDKLGLKPEVVSVAAAGQPLAATLIEGALENARYRALRSIVTAADTTVRDASLQLAAILYDYEEKTVNEKAAAFSSSLLEQSKIVNTGNRAARLAALEAVEKAKAELEAEDDKRLSLVVFKIPAAHSAIAKSLDEKATLEEFVASQNRIFDLVEQTDAFVKAVEDL